MGTTTLMGTFKQVKALNQKKENSGEMLGGNCLFRRW